jgi:hypothetical protein
MSGGVWTTGEWLLLSTELHLSTVHWLTAKFLLVLASTLILGSEAHGTHDHILLSGGLGGGGLLDNN